MLIQRLREGSDGILAKILVGLIVVVFAMFGLGSITTFLAPVPKVAEVNGAEVTQQEMEIAVERNRRIMLAQNANMFNEDSLREDVLQSLISRKLLIQVTENLDLSFSDEQLDQEIVSNEVFQVDGEFSKEQFQLVIGSAGFSPLIYRAEMRRDKVFEQLTNAIGGTGFVTDRVITRVGSVSEQSRDVAFLRVDVDALVSDIELSEEDLQNAYQNAVSDYATEETVDIGYVELKLTDLADEITFTEEDLVVFFEDTKDQYSTEERRRFAHILIEATEDDSALEEVTTLHGQILAGGDFGQLSRDNSDDPGSAANNGDLGFSEPGGFVEEFEAVGSELSLNEVSEPVKTEFGYHIIKLMDVEPGNYPILDEVRIDVETAFRLSFAEELFVTRSARLGELAFESADLKMPASELNLNVKSTGMVGRSATDGVAGNPAVMSAAFGADLLLDGNNSDVIEINPNYHVVVHTNSHQSSEIRPFEDVVDEVREKLARERAAGLAAQQAAEMVEMLETGSVARYVADQYGLQWEVVAKAKRSSTNLEAAIRTEAFSLPKPDENTKSIGSTILPDGDAVVISVTNVENKPEEAITSAEIAMLGRGLASQKGFIDYQEFRKSLADVAEIERFQ